MLVDADEKEIFRIRPLPNQKVTQDTHNVSNEPSFRDFSKADMEEE